MILFWWIWVSLVLILLCNSNCWFAGRAKLNFITVLKLASSAFLNIEHTHPFNGLFPGLPGWASTRKVKPIWISLKQETVSGSGISWAIRKSAPRSRQITTPAPHHSVFLQAGCPSCRPTNSVKVLKAKTIRDAILPCNRTLTGHLNLPHGTNNKKWGKQKNY